MRSVITKNLPDWFYQMAVGDYPLKVISAHYGKIYYIDEIMSVYQKGVSGSFTERHATILKEAEREKGELILYSYLDDYTGHKYTDLMKKYLDHRKIEYFFLHGNLDYLDLSKFQKMALRRLAVLARPFPKNIRRRYLEKIVGIVQK